METVLRLAEDLVPYVIRGDKRITLRKGHREFGPEVEIAGYTAVVDSVEYFKLKDVPLEVLNDDGFENHDDALQGMKRFYPDITMETEMTAIRFHLPQLL